MGKKAFLFLFLLVMWSLLLLYLVKLSSPSFAVWIVKSLYFFGFKDSNIRYALSLVIMLTTLCVVIICWLIIFKYLIIKKLKIFNRSNSK